MAAEEVQRDVICFYRHQSRSSRAARAAADASIVVEMNAMQADIDQNEADSDAAELSLTTRLGAEEVRAAAAEASLETRLAAEEGARAAADSSIDTAMAAMQADIDANEAEQTQTWLVSTTSGNTRVAQNQQLYQWITSSCSQHKVTDQWTTLLCCC